MRQKLTRAIGRHCNAVLALLDEKDPDSLSLVLQALRPVEVFRAQVSSSGSAGGSVVPVAGEAAAPDEAADR